MGTPGPVDSRAVGDPVSADPGSRSGGRRNALEEIDQHIAVDHPLHASHSARSSRIRVVLLIPFPLQAPKACSRPGRCSSASKRATARRTASAREIPRDWHKRAKALTCSSGRSTIVLMMTSSYIAVPKEHKLRSSPRVAGSHAGASIACCRNKRSSQKNERPAGNIPRAALYQSSRVIDSLRSFLGASRHSARR